MPLCESAIQRPMGVGGGLLLKLDSQSRSTTSTRENSTRLHSPRSSAKGGSHEDLVRIGGFDERLRLRFG